MAVLHDMDVDQYDEVEDRSYLLQPSFYLGLLKRRLLFFVIPFVIILACGSMVAYLWPATYLSEGKLLVQTQQIPSELVKSTVTTLANERIQVIEQRVMTRDNLLAIIDKFKLFPERRDLMSVTELVNLMRTSTSIQAVIPTRPTSRGENPTIAFTVGFYSRDPVQATRVANEFVTRILNEDLRDRTSRATDTTKFLAREVDRLRAESGALDRKITAAKMVGSAGGPDQANAQLTQLKLDLVQKSVVYSDQSPIIQALKRQIDALEKSMVRPPDGANPVGGVEALEAQQEAVQKNLEATDQKLSAAKLGESLEREQQSEKLEVIEQPTEPQEPIKPNRPKIVALAFFAALAAGAGVAFAAEMLDKSIRRSSDIFRVVDSQLVMSIPYIETAQELVAAKKKRSLALKVLAGVVVLGLIASYFLLPPLDLIIAKARVGLFR